MNNFFTRTSLAMIQLQNMCYTSKISVTYTLNDVINSLQMKQCLIVGLLFFCSSLPCLLAQAPGDEDSFCAVSNSTNPPLFPSNIRVLMDSFNYINLLMPLQNRTTAWQQVPLYSITSAQKWFQILYIIQRHNLLPQINSRQLQSLVNVWRGSSGELSGRNPTLSCHHRGQWGLIQDGTGCECNSGYEKAENETCLSELFDLISPILYTLCTNNRGCPSNYYLATSLNFSCKPCPQNSKSEGGAVGCECVLGYFRVPGALIDQPCSCKCSNTMHGM